MCRSVRMERIDKRGIRSVKRVLRSVSRISLVGLRIFSWQEWSYTVCRSVRIKSKRRTFAFKVRLLLFLVYREGTLNLYRACLEILRLNITFLVLAYLAFTFGACLY